MIGNRDAVERRDRAVRQAKGLEGQALALRAENIRLETVRQKLQADVDRLTKEQSSLTSAVYVERQRLEDVRTEAANVDPEAQVVRMRRLWSERYGTGAVA